MTLRNEFASLVAYRYAGGFQARLRGTRDLVESATISCAPTIKSSQGVSFRFKAERANYGHGQPIITIRAEEVGSNRGGSIGILEFVEAPNNIVWMKIPPYRGSESENAWSPDNDGRLFALFLSRLFDEFEKLGFSSKSADTTDLLKPVLDQLAAAGDSTAYASVGNTCRAVLIELANSVYDDDMKPEDEPAPKGDDATAKLRIFIGYKLSTVTPRYVAALQKSVDVTWELANALLHRKNAKKRDAETCVDLTNVTTTAVLKLRDDSD